MHTEDGHFQVDTPRDRADSFEHLLIKNHQRRFTSMDDKILFLYAQGMSTRGIATTIKEMYGVDIEGHKELLGLWISENEGAKFWLNVLTELQNLGVKDILIACIDGLKGFPDAINAVYPDTQIQLCIVHMVRNAMKFVPWKDYKAVAADLKRIYKSATEEEALQALAQFAERWDDKYPQISKSWHAHWHNLNTLSACPQDIRKAIYTTNAIESLNSVIRKAVKKRKLFPSDDSAKKVVYLAIQEASKKWTMPIRNWKPALNRFIIEFEGRLTDYIYPDSYTEIFTGSAAKLCAFPHLDS